MESIDQPALNDAVADDAGVLSFRATTDTMGSLRTGLFRVSGASYTKLFTHDDAAPGLPAGSTFSSLSPRPTVNPQGRLLFNGEVVGA